MQEIHNQLTFVFEWIAELKGQTKDSTTAPEIGYTVAKQYSAAALRSADYKKASVLVEYYDRFDRPVLTGHVTDKQNRAALSTYVESEITPTGNKWYETGGQ